MIYEVTQPIFSRMFLVHVRHEQGPDVFRVKNTRQYVTVPAAGQKNRNARSDTHADRMELGVHAADRKWIFTVLRVREHGIFHFFHDLDTMKRLFTAARKKPIRIR